MRIMTESLARSSTSNPRVTGRILTLTLCRSPDSVSGLTDSAPLKGRGNSVDGALGSPFGGRISGLPRPAGGEAGHRPESVRDSRGPGEGRPLTESLRLSANRRPTSHAT